MNFAYIFEIRNEEDMTKEPCMQIHNTGIRFDKKVLFWTLVLLLITGFPSLSFLNHTLYRIWMFLSFLEGLFIPFIYIKNKKFNTASILGLLFLVIPVLSTFLQRTGNYLYAVRQFYYCAMIILIIDCMIKEIGIKRTLNVLTIMFEVLVYANLLAMIINPGGMFLYVRMGNSEMWMKVNRGFHRVGEQKVAWLLDHQGILTIYAITGTCCSFLYSCLKSKTTRLSFRTVVFMIVSSVEIFLFARAGNPMLTYALFLIGYFVLHNRKRIRLPSIRALVVALFIFFFLIVYTDVLQYFSFLIVNILHRDITLTRRTLVWENSIIAILKKPLWGYGYIDSEQAWQLFVYAAHPHNQFLQIAYQGGLIAETLFVAYLFHALRGIIPVDKKGIRFGNGKSLKSISKQKSSSNKLISKVNNEIFIILWIGTITLLIGMLGDRYIPFYNIALILFCLCGHMSIYMEEEKQ